MKKIHFLLCLVAMSIMLVAAATHPGWKAHRTPKKSSGCGYTIIELGIGVDCNGDTVKLVKSRGFQRLAS
jgi:hypothetical protein